MGTNEEKDERLVNDTDGSVNLSGADKTREKKSLAFTLDELRAHSEKPSATPLLRLRQLCQTVVENPDRRRPPPPPHPPPPNPTAPRSVPSVWTLKPATRSGSSERVSEDVSYQPLFVLQQKETAALARFFLRPRLSAG